MRFMDRSYRNLIREMAWSQLAVQDQNSVLGLIWSFLSPALTVGVLFAYFHMNAGKDVAHYGIYLLIGMVHYTHFSNTTASAMNSLHSMAQLTRHTVLPKEALVIGTVMMTSIEFCVSMAICLVLAFFTGVPLKACLLAAPLIMLLQLVFATWVSFLLVTVRVFVKDLNHLYQLFLRLLFFTTPIFYAAAFLNSPLAQRALRVNLLAQLIGFSRDLFLGGHLFPVKFFLLLTLFHCVALVISFRWFKRCEPLLAEYV